MFRIKNVGHRQENPQLLIAIDDSCIAQKTRPNIIYIGLNMSKTFGFILAYEDEKEMNDTMNYVIEKESFFMIGKK